MADYIFFDGLFLDFDTDAQALRHGILALGVGDEGAGVDDLVNVKAEAGADVGRQAKIGGSEASPRLYARPIPVSSIPTATRQGLSSLARGCRVLDRLVAAAHPARFDLTTRPAPIWNALRASSTLSMLSSKQMSV